LTLFVQTHYRRDSVPNQKESTALKKIIEHYYLTKSRNNDTYFSFLNFVDFVEASKDNLLSTLEIDSEYFDLREFLFLLSDFRKTGCMNSFIGKMNIQLFNH